jgi:TPR repeat protein
MMAQYNVGVMYEDGVGVAQDYKVAVKWYRLAAEQGYANAQGNLGAMYANGKGVPKDNVMAHMWLIIGASNGSPSAPKNKEIIAKRLTAAEISKSQKLAKECVAREYKGC